jgi:hypothetical protein
MDLVGQDIKINPRMNVSSAKLREEDGLHISHKPREYDIESERLSTNSKQSNKIKFDKNENK